MHTRSKAFVVSLFRSRLLGEPNAGAAAERTCPAACRNLADAGQTIVLVEQNLAATLALAHRTNSLNNGHTVHESSPDEFKSQPEILRRHLGV